jgi:amino-acid N-acetyltransferase
MNLEEVDEFLAANKNAEPDVISVLEKAKEACRRGVTRVHIVDGNLDGVLPCEIFSELGSGTMIYTSNYGKIRAMTQTDIPSVLGIMRPFVEKGNLLERTEAQLAGQLSDFVVYEIDGGVHACAALHFYDDGQAEIAAVAVDENDAHRGIGPKLMDNLIEQAVQAEATSIFIMTTQTADWFENLGFEESDLTTIPEERRKLWDSRRGSKVYRLKK